MGQLGSRLDLRVRRASRRSHSSALSPPSVHEISSKERRSSVADGARVQHVRTAGARRLSKEPWDARKYEWRAEGESWSGPDGAVSEDDSGDYENPISMRDLEGKLSESPIRIPRVDYDRILAGSPVSTPKKDLDRSLAESPVNMPPEDLDRSLSNPEWYSMSFGNDDCDSSTGEKTETGKEKDHASPTAEFDPQDFMDLVPQTDTEGVEIAPWKRLIIGRQMAEIARRKKEEQTLKDKEEAKYYELPRWKRALIQKTEAKLREKQDKRLEDELSMTPTRMRDLSMLLDEDGLPIPDPLDDEISLTESDN